MMGSTVRATTIGEAARIERENASFSSGRVRAFIGGFVELVPIPVGLLRLFSWLFVIVFSILTGEAVIDWIKGYTFAGRDVAFAGTGLVAAVASAFVSGRLIGWLNTWADRAGMSSALVRQATLAADLLEFLVGDRLDTECDYQRELRSLHGWIDDGGHIGNSFTWFSLKVPWGEDTLSITADIEYEKDALRVDFTETWRFQGPLSGDTERIRRHLDDDYEIVTCTSSELVIRHYEWVQRHSSRGCISTPFSAGGALESEVLVKTLPLLLESTDKRRTVPA